MTLVILWLFILSDLKHKKVKTSDSICNETNTKGKKKKNNKKSAAQNENQNIITKQNSNNETSKQSLDLMEAMMDDFGLNSGGSERNSSISHSISVDDSTACDLAIELNPKKRVTRAQTRKWTELSFFTISYKKKRILLNIISTKGFWKNKFTA